METILDLQFEVITTHLNDGGKPPRTQRDQQRPCLYQCALRNLRHRRPLTSPSRWDRVPVLGELLECPPLRDFTDPKSWFDRRDEIKAILRDHLRDSHHASSGSTSWNPPTSGARKCCTGPNCGRTEGYQALDMEQTIRCPGGTEIPTLRCPIRIDGRNLQVSQGRPIHRPAQRRNRNRVPTLAP